MAHQGPNSRLDYERFSSILEEDHGVVVDVVMHNETCDRYIATAWVERQLSGIAGALADLVAGEGR
jgi:hypothetical protein